MKIIKNQSVKESMQLTITEKDMLRRFMEDDHTEKCIIAYYITAKARKSENIRTIASEYQIKASWANTAFEIGKKLMFKEINKIKRMKRDIPIRLENVA